MYGTYTSVLDAYEEWREQTELEELTGEYIRRRPYNFHEDFDYDFDGYMEEI